jgi:hypothetical protein
LSLSHVRLHKLTLKQYRQIYGPLTVQDASAALAKTPRTASEVADALLGSPELTDALSEGVTAHLFGPGTRGKLLVAASVVIAARMAAYEHYLALKAKVLAELGRDWRITSAGEYGSPTPTSELLHMLSALGMEQSAAEATLIKIIQQAIAERKSPMQLIMGIGVSGRAYSGTYESLAELNKEQRDRVRTIDEALMTGSQEGTARALLMSGVLLPEDYKQITGREPDAEALEHFKRQSAKVIDVKSTHEG